VGNDGWKYYKDEQHHLPSRRQQLIYIQPDKHENIEEEHIFNSCCRNWSHMLPQSFTSAAAALGLPHERLLKLALKFLAVRNWNSCYCRSS